MLKYDEDFLEDKFKELLNKIDQHFAKFANVIDFVDDPIIDNYRFLQLMNVSPKTAQLWRDKRLVAYSQIGNKIYYRLSDIRELLDKFYKAAHKDNS